VSGRGVNPAGGVQRIETARLDERKLSMDVVPCFESISAERNRHRAEPRVGVFSERRRSSHSLFKKEERLE
jgi:hypothetical protein